MAHAEKSTSNKVNVPSDRPDNDSLQSSNQTDNKDVIEQEKAEEGTLDKDQRTVHVSFSIINDKGGNVHVQRRQSPRRLTKQESVTQSNHRPDCMSVISPHDSKKPAILPNQSEPQKKRPGRPKGSKNKINNDSPPNENKTNSPRGKKRTHSNSSYRYEPGTKVMRYFESQEAWYIGTLQKPIHTTQGGPNLYRIKYADSDEEDLSDGSMEQAVENYARLQPYIRKIATKSAPVKGNNSFPPKQYAK